MDKKILIIDGNRFSDFEGLVYEFNVNVFGDEKPTDSHRTWTGGLTQFYDLLRGGYGTPEGSFTIHWLNSHKSREDLGHAANLALLERLIEKKIVHPTRLEGAKKEIELLKNGKGETLFETIVDLIVSHNNIKLILD